MPTRLTQDQFIARAHRKHGDRYDYSQVEYVTNETKVIIQCQDHGPFTQEPRHHISGAGCPYCKSAATIRRLIHDTTQFIQQARIVHGDTYDYSRVNYQRAALKVEIICKAHGPFWQTPNNHLSRRSGCPKCAGKFLTTPEFIDKAREVHGDRFSYEHTNYQTIKGNVIITCKKHGDFSQPAESHLIGNGCIKCWRETRTSKGEMELAEWIAANGLPMQCHAQGVLSPRLELDIYLPSLKIGIEYNGCYWHSDRIEGGKRETYNKHEQSRTAGIRLITVWDFDWRHRQSIIKHHLLNAMGLSNKPRIHARECEVVDLTAAEASRFYEANHLQGACHGGILHFGLQQAGQTVAAMSFTQGGARRGKVSDGEWELARYATSALVRGGASRLFHRFVESERPETVWSFSDNQYFAGTLYECLGFQMDGIVTPDYRLVHPSTLTVWHKSQWQRRHIPNRMKDLGIHEPFDPATDPRTEFQMQNLAGVLRVWDAGKIRWRWNCP